MVKRSHPQRTSAALAELQTALEMQEAAEKLVATKLARLATLLSNAAEPRQAGQKLGPVLVVNNPPLRQAPRSDTAA
jgi:hypothetical protein